MSKQLNFFIHPNDLAPIFGFFQENVIKYVVETINNANDIVLHDFPYTDGNPYNGIYLTSEQFGDQFKLAEDLQC